MSEPTAIDPQIYRHPDAVPDLQGSWSVSQVTAAFYNMGYNDYRALGTFHSDADLRIAVARSEAGPDLMLPFRVGRHWHRFTLGERCLATLAVRSLALANPWLAEGHPAGKIAELLVQGLQEERADLIEIGEIPEESSLQAALEELVWPARKLRLGRKKSLRWLIDLPDSFDAFFARLSRKDRKNLGWKMRKLAKEFEVQIEVFKDADSIERFLEEGERISRRTYQWSVGQQLVNDHATRERYRALAEEGRLRCYLLYLDGTARAFARGSVQGDIFLEDTPGYDPDFAKYSIGTVLMMEALKDLIGTSSCRVFDFGTGGDATGFKSRFGTRHILCNSYYVVNMRRPRAVVIFLGHRLLSFLKNLGSAVIAEGPFRDKLKRRIRKYGD